MWPTPCLRSEWTGVESSCSSNPLAWSTINDRARRVDVVVADLACAVPCSGLDGPAANRAYVREVEAKYYIIMEILHIVQMAISLCGSRRILLYIQATLYLHWTLQSVRFCHRGRYTTVYDVSANSVMWLSSTYSMCCQNFLPQNLDILVFQNI